MHNYLRLFLLLGDFININFEFRDRIIKQYHSLANAELRPCMLMKLNLSIKDIAKVLSQELNTLK